MWTRLSAIPNYSIHKFRGRPSPNSIHRMEAVGVLRAVGRATGSLPKIRMLQTKYSKKGTKASKLRVLSKTSFALARGSIRLRAGCDWLAAESDGDYGPWCPAASLNETRYTILDA